MAHPRRPRPEQSRTAIQLGACIGCAHPDRPARRFGYCVVCRARLARNLPVDLDEYLTPGEAHRIPTPPLSFAELMQLT
jgi:hypothetical protein